MVEQLFCKQPVTRSNRVAGSSFSSLFPTLFGHSFILRLMESIEMGIVDASKLISVHGCWPSFHDAEILDFHIWRNHGAISLEYPILTTKVHVFIGKPDTQHALTTLRFERVQDLTMHGFNHQNSVYGISIQPRSNGGFSICFDSALGMGASFDCSVISVVDAQLCTADAILGSAKTE